MSGFFFAAASVASPRRKPTVVMLLQFCCTIASMLSLNAEGEFDSTSPVLTPSVCLAVSSPSCEVWLNDLSWKPPESETMQALKSAFSAGGAELSVADGLSEAVVSPSPLVESSRWPQPASASAAMLKAAAARAVLLTRPPGSPADGSPGC